MRFASGQLTNRIWKSVLIMGSQESHGLKRGTAEANFKNHNESSISNFLSFNQVGSFYVKPWDNQVFHQRTDRQFHKTS